MNLLETFGTGFRFVLFCIRKGELIALFVFLFVYLFIHFYLGFRFWGILRKFTSKVLSTFGCCRVFI